MLTLYQFQDSLDLLNNGCQPWMNLLVINCWIHFNFTDNTQYVNEIQWESLVKLNKLRLEYLHYYKLKLELIRNQWCCGSRLIRHHWCWLCWVIRHQFILMNYNPIQNKVWSEPVPKGWNICFIMPTINGQHC